MYVCVCVIITSTWMNEGEWERERKVGEGVVEWKERRELWSSAR